MADSNTQTYEALILLAQNAAADLAAAVEHVKGILTRHHAEILVLKKWDERKLAYPIRGQKRGIYLLSYFKAPTAQLTPIDRDFTLSENITRALITRADHVGEVELDLAKRDENIAVEAKLREHKAEADAPAAEAEGKPADVQTEANDAK